MRLHPSGKFFIELLEFIEHQIKRLAIGYYVMHHQDQHPFFVRKSQHATPNQGPASEMESTRRLFRADFPRGDLALVRVEIAQVAFFNSKILMLEDMLLRLAVGGAKYSS